MSTRGEITEGAAGDTDPNKRLLKNGATATTAGNLDDLVQYVTLHVRIPTPLSGVVLPFVPLYLTALYLCIYVYGGGDVAVATAQELISSANQTTADSTIAWNDIGFIAVLAIAFLHVLTLLFCYWSVHVLAFLTCRKTKLPALNVLAKVVPTANNGNSKIVPIRATKLEDGTTEYFLVFQKTKYVWNEDRKTFRAVEFPVNGLLKNYAASRGLESDEAVKRATTTYGNNEMDMVVPEFHELFLERATAPFFVFQVFSVGLWCMDDYWYYSLFTLFMLIAFECTIVKQQLRNMSEIRKMGNKPYLIYAFRQNKWRHIGSDELLPGDLVSVTRSQNDNIVPCDLVILRGNCIVDESMLTGESVPLMKESLESLDSLDTELDVDGDGKLFVLFGGTKVVQHTAPTKESLRAPDGGCIGYVIRTGFNTSQGKLLRTILFGANRATENNKETFAFIAFLMVFAVAAASYVWVKGSEDLERNRYKLFLECTLILTAIIPPDLPIELTLAVNTSLIQLTKLFVFCTEPFRIPFAGKVQICCFDKTGTLTTDNLMVEGIAGLTSNGTCVPIEQAEANTVQVLACCHSLALLDDGLVGDPLEKATLAAVDWTLTKMDSVIPKRAQLKPLKIIQRYHFSSALKRMSVLAGYLMPYSNEVKHIGAVKGAPEVIQNMLREVPSDYEKIYLEYARRGARVLALGIKEFGSLSAQRIRELKRDEVECDLTFAGFVIISCPMKPDSKSVIKELIQSSHKVVMITGDSPLTACHVAKELRFTRKKLLILTPPEPSKRETWSWVSVDGEHSYQLDERSRSISLMLATHDLCITGEGLLHLQHNQPQYMRQLLPQVTVCARFAPKQKEFVITTLKQLGFCTLMCGDGTNDVGALKHANVGVSLLTSAPAKRKRTEEEQQLANAAAAAATAAAAHTANQQLSPRERALRRRQEHITQSQARMQSALRDLEEQTMVKLGDASIAAPFTSKSSSIMCVNHIIKQGRCTLVTTLQMFKILALNSLIQAYCQSVLYIDGIKFSDTQATMQGIFIAACFLFITRSKPLKTLSKVAPLPNIFNFYTISTILTQFAVHFGTLYYLTSEATKLAPPRVGKVKLFIDMDAEEKTKFDPNIVNSTVYIICISLQVATIAVNYKGHPFMESLRSNRMLVYAIGASASLVLLLSTGLVPDLTEFFEIFDFPTDFRRVLITVLVMDIIGAFLLDRICSFLFGETRRKSKVLNC
ncbi:manganese-transporting ATPase 13A1 [Drosophila guanche]|uniref:Blast:Probable cation-transporting ATPase 13A1 n=1 Tax=Drosophila guanche TaxID=7266 RepID=A0A3B0JBQ6_DROGU|nr:manganese-transporting ATPase 13A1 [Drosophila guanche]SPP79475.1 blast:Probable cation-transporting ATPase 13A1 [Drosophila guanche]